ncbi:MAG: DUF1189 family protein [Candidatus Levyibacteriota bacterium]
MGFLNTIRNSIFSPEFYASIPKKSAFSALGYFLLLSLLLTIIQSVQPFMAFVNYGQPEIQKFVNQAAEAYPSGLEVTIQKGQVHTNVQEPYVIPLPGNDNNGTYKNLVVIDTKTPYSSSQFNAYRTVAWVGKDTVFMVGDNNGQIKTVDLSKVSDFKLNRTSVDSFITQVKPWLKVITPVVAVGIILGLFMLHVFRLLYLLFLALLIWLLAKIMKKNQSYGVSYKMGMYAMTLGMVLEVVFDFAHFSGFPFLFTLVALGVVTINLNPAPAAPTVKSAPKKSPAKKK